MLARLRAGAAVLLLFLLFAPAASADDYIVVLKGGDPNAAATKQRVQPKQVYKAAVDGYSATMTPAQAARIAADSSVAGVYADRRFQGLHPEGLTHNPFIRTGDQLVPGSVRRVGAESSPTAHIDGVDQRVDADVAVIDTGIGVHSDLNVVGSHNCNTGTDTDVDGHGTMVSGSLAAIDDMRDSIVGVAPGARLWSLKVFDDQGNAEFSNVLCAVDWVTAHAKTIDVANMSLGDFGADDGNCGYTNGDILHQAICRSVAAGVTYVAAAGNESEDASRIIPASYDEVITVSSFADYNGTKKKNDGTNNCGAPAPDEAFSEFSNFGADIDIAAPGECDTTDYPNQMFAFGSGTSSAAPHVSGAAALLKAGHPAWTPAQVKAAIVGNEEHSSLPGDPDHFNEGIVNVAGF